VQVEEIKTEKSFARLKDKYIKSYSSISVLVLLGEEELFKKSLITAIKSFLFEDEGDLDMNYSVFYDKNDTVYDLPIDISNTPPFGSNKRLIVIHNYDSFMDKDDFLNYIEKPNKTTLLILVSSGVLEKDSIYKYFSNKDNDNVLFLNFPKPKDSDLNSFVYSFMLEKGKKINRDALDYLLENINIDYTSIKSELEKICNYHNDKSDLTVDDIKDFTYSSKHANVFDFINAILERDRRKCFSVMVHLKDDATTTINLIMHSFVILYYLKIFPPQTSLNDMSKIINLNPKSVSMKKKYINNFTLNEISFIISELTRLNTISVTKPFSILKAYFYLFLFTITK